MKPLPDTKLELNPFLVAAADRIRDWRSKFAGLAPLALEPEMASIIGSLEGEQVIIHNELHFATGLRKLHLEVAAIGSDLQILHCIFFPDPKFNIPIFGTDIVVASLGITAAIVDLSPSASALPKEVLEKLEKIDIPNFNCVRELPEWGNIFSPYVQFIRPNSKLEESFFLDLIDDYLHVLFSVVANTSSEESYLASTIERYQGQINYCNQQKLNDKTKAVLSKAFSPLWAERYIGKLLFDTPPPLSN